MKKSSRHYFFKLSAFSDQLKDWLESNDDLQSEPRNYVLNWIKEGLQDWDITRDITWGIKIPLPEAEGKVLYGWFDNHLCYISTALKVAGKEGKAGHRLLERLHRSTTSSARTSSTTTTSSCPA